MDNGSARGEEKRETQEGAHNEEARRALIAQLRQRARDAAVEWTPTQCRVRGAAFLCLAAVMLVFHPAFWRGTRLEWATTFWPLAVIMLWVWALVQWLALSYYREN